MDVTPRFLTLEEVAEVLHTSRDQAYRLVRRGDLRAIKIGGRGQWRIEVSALEEYIATGYMTTEQYIAENPYEPSATDEDSVR